MDRGITAFPSSHPAVTCSPQRRLTSHTAQKTVQVQVGQISTVDLQLPLLTPIVSIEVHEVIAGVQTNNANISSNADPHQLADRAEPRQRSDFLCAARAGSPVEHERRRRQFLVVRFAGNFEHLHH